jgi:putative transposase
VWTLPEGDADFSTRWRLFKMAFSRKLVAGEPISSSRAGKGERGIWQRRYGSIRFATRRILSVT